MCVCCAAALCILWCNIPLRLTVLGSLNLHCSSVMDVSAVLERNSTAPVQAWVSNTNTRGTYDIIWSCVQTVFLCAWVSVCVNAPSRKYRSRDLLVDKFYFTLLTLLGPELVFALACCQYSAARRSVQDFKRKKVVLAGCSPWTITHGFYANMGCITVRPPTSPHRRTQDFRVNAKELLYLVEHGHMDYPDVPREEIMSRSKVDGLGRHVPFPTYQCQPLAD